MSWTLPLAALSAISNFNYSSIPSQNHFQRTIDTDAAIWSWRSYKTSPHTPPHVRIERFDDRLFDGYIFLTPADQKTKQGTHELSGTGLIMTDDGDLVFAGEENGYSFCQEWVAGMTDFRVQQYKGRPHLVYWNGCNTQGAHWGHRWGRVTFIDEEYNNFTINPDMHINSLDGANKGQIDVHDHEMTDRNSIVVTTYNNTQADLTSFGRGPNGWLAESMFAEVDVDTGEVLFEWSAADHIPLEDSRWPLRGPMGTQQLPWDWFHINSAQRVGEDYLISSRHHWAVYLISGKNGRVIWKLDGVNGGSFGSIPSEFKWQHHARAQNVTEHGMTISLFSNHANAIADDGTQTEALAFWVPLPASKDHPPQLVRKLVTEQSPVFSLTQGSYQLDLGNGNEFVGYGKIPLAREYGPAEDGSDLRWQARFGRDDAAMSYRAFKSKWHGTPKNWDPVVVFEEVRLQKQKPAKVYVSWNGATDISSWAVYAGENRESLMSVGVAERMGFETVFSLEGASCVQLGAIRNGKIIRASNVACLHEVEADLEKYPEDVDAGVDDHGDATNAGLEEIEAENDSLKTKVGEQEKALEDLKTGMWLSHQLFGVAAVAAAFVLGFVGWRSWQRLYWDFVASLRRSMRDRLAGMSVSEAEIGGYAGVEEWRNSPENGGLELDNEDEDAARATARTPFIRDR